MDYQIAYLNVYGNAGVLADEMQAILAGAELVDLNKQEISDDADVYLLVFEITQAAIPLKIMDALENLEGKTILCCITCGMALHESKDSIEAGNLRNVYLYGALMIVLAFFGLVFGVLAGRFAASASAGFACNLRQSMFENIQTFSFSNIDKFSTAGLVTRMTTDVTNLQMAFQMCLRIALRAPLMLICSMMMCLLINAKLRSCIHKRLSKVWK